ncbi:MAG: tripartite tricarboxylate transporter substrate binding protein [Betaproteobacteria bacterium]|nr:tripartite tricarboxylate transporter substrate binding protein [Betaproteobacteria bacterium]
MTLLFVRNKYYILPYLGVIFFFFIFNFIKQVNAQGDVNYPSRPVKLLVTFPPGGAGDMTGRAVARGLQAIWNQPVIVENIPGGAGSIAAEMVVRAPPDGSVLFLSSAGPTAVLPFIRDKLTYDPLVDLTPIAMSVSIPNILVVSSKSNFKTFQEFITTAKSTPGGLNYASSGRGESHHMMMEYLMKATGIKLNEIPYKGGAPAVLAVSAGEVHAAWLAVSTALPLIRSGQLLGLAVSTQDRVSQIPEIPSVSEQGFPGFDFSFWMGIMGPAKMSAALVKKIEGDLRTVILSESYRDAIGKMGSIARYEGQEQFSKTLKDTYNRNKEALLTK